MLRNGRTEWCSLDNDRLVLDSGIEVDADDAVFLAPVEPSKIIAVHLAYRSKMAERGRVPAVPSYFLKPPNALAGHRGQLRLPRGAHYLSYEGELAVVIGRRMKGVGVDDALEYVAGYTVANDVGLHDFRQADRGSNLRSKGQDGFLPIGPAVVPADAWSAHDFTLRTYLNGEVVQETTAEDVFFPIEYLLADIARLITLEPGDVLLTGTPSGSRVMRVGDVVEIEISGLGRLASEVVDWDVDLSGVGAQPEVTPQTLEAALGLSLEEAERHLAAQRTASDQPAEMT
jgi:5-oxopent-3-ene-1,2,5-tricarboxylate decarboxylase/2-hydroxyhepta-2,4-diene-1,7-dioate isomerase